MCREDGGQSHSQISFIVLYPTHVRRARRLPALELRRQHDRRVLSASCPRAAWGVVVKKQFPAPNLLNPDPLTSTGTGYCSSLQSIHFGAISLPKIGSLVI